MKTAAKIVMIVILCLAMMLTACSSGGDAPAVSTEQGSKETLPEKDKTEVATKEAANTTAAPETTAEPATPEETEPPTAPVYEGDMDPAAVFERVKVWDESLNQYTGLFSDKKVLLKEEKFEAGKDKPKTVHRFAYDALGNERIYAYYEEDGTLYDWAITEYDENGHKISMIRYSPSTPGKIGLRVVYTNDVNGNVIKEEKYTGDDTVCSNWDEYEVDASGNTVKRYGYRNGVLDFTYEYAYTDSGDLTHTWRYDKEGKLSFHTENVYDAEGHKIAENDYDPETDTVSGTAKAEWSEDFHKRTAEQYSDSGKFSGMNVKLYDDDGNVLVSENYDKNGDLESKWVYTYSE